MKNYFERLQVIADDRIAIDDCYMLLASEMLGTHQDKKGNRNGYFVVALKKVLMDLALVILGDFNKCLEWDLFELFQRRLV
ncbi:hypothetical protein [Piscirickettsia salmonis]|uniref:hypothetical protein n=1 Tax=Piscirickettsia salmonis TaxID=1238 RepID=UPI00143CFB64|nr:hypothetical protein [Piscirickettsia salmonis]QIX57593.1 hypothetical protein GW536_19800 [Piscirickettsia salmonis]